MTKEQVFTIARSSYPLSVSLFYKEDISPKGYLLYFHGGGLLFGTREDLPKETVEFFCQNGFFILAFDYGLAPYTKFPEILLDVKDAILWFLNNQASLFIEKLPWFLWGRSAGAYLCLLSTLTSSHPYPNGILSYYGYGFLEPHWYQIPNDYYNQFPLTDDSDYSTLLLEGPCTCATLEKRYSLYVSARQTGQWISYFYDGKLKEFHRNYTALFHQIPKNYPPVFLTHALQDPDVPFAESKRLQERLPKATLVPISASCHDFDRNSKSYATIQVLEKSLEFLESNLN